MFFTNKSNLVFVQLGQQIYDTRSEALAGRLNESFDQNPPLTQSATFRGWLTVRAGATDLSNPVQAIWTSANRFESVERNPTFIAYADRPQKLKVLSAQDVDLVLTGDEADEEIRVFFEPTTDRNLTLPSAATHKHLSVVVTKVSGNRSLSITINPIGVLLINPGDSAILKSDGTNWYVVGEVSPTFHDRQALQLAGGAATSSLVYVDIPGASLITKNLGDTGNYNVACSVETEGDVSGWVANIRVCFDGVVCGERTIKRGGSSKDDPTEITVLVDQAAITAGSIIQVQWSTAAGTLTLNALDLTIDGVLDSRVI
jgi:hypothetical protein